MSTNSFDRKFVITDMESAIRLMEFINAEEPVATTEKRPFYNEIIDRGEELLKQCPLR